MLTRQNITSRLFQQAFLAAVLLVLGLAVTRLAYEAFFPRLLWLARPLPVIIFAALFALVGWFCARRFWRTPYYAALLPLLLNLPYLLLPQVELLLSRVLFVVSIWLSATLLFAGTGKLAASRLLAPLLLLVALLPVYLSTMGQTVGRADTFEFQVVVPQLGIAHPTGYPLYMLLGKLFTLLPFSSVAWRLNLASVVFALAALIILFATAWMLTRRPLPGLLAAVALGLTPTFWSQAVEAEVYALHALIVASGLGLMVLMLRSTRADGAFSVSWRSRQFILSWKRQTVLLAFLVGLGLTNHLTTVFLLPPAFFTILLVHHRSIRQATWRERGALLLAALLAFMLPLLLYAYLPLRWAAVNDEPMGLPRFLDWIVGGRFQGALQLDAWLNDMTRYQVLGRLFLENWGAANLAIALLGLLFLWRSAWRPAFVLSVAWLGFAFYALNYYVPDLAVFLIAADLVVALVWAAGVGSLLGLFSRLPLNIAIRQLAVAILLTLLALPILLSAVDNWPRLDRSDANQLLYWGEGVLALPLEQNAAILADSEKIAPLYYLQQAEGVRPDLAIVVLPDEAAYRAELESRLAQGQTVYLARFLPGLEGQFHLRSLGPLVEVSAAPQSELPATATDADFDFDPLQLVGYHAEPTAAVDPAALAVTLYWRAPADVHEPRFVYVRWSAGGRVGLPDAPTGQHPVANYYPTSAWSAGEIVPDYHLLPKPLGLHAETLDIQVALGPAFAAAGDLEWQTVAETSIEPPPLVVTGAPLRVQAGAALIDGAAYTDKVRPQSQLQLLLAGYGAALGVLDLQLVPVPAAPSAASSPPAPSAGRRVVRPLEVAADVSAGSYDLVAQYPGSGARCGWLAQPTTGCVLGRVEVSGVPLPPGAVNFDDKIALLDADFPTEITSGGRLPLTLTWQALAAMAEDYTVFIQVLDSNDRIVGQVDAWPLQGTFPTSQWSPGEVVEDPHIVQLEADLPPGDYRLQAGWYLLGTLRRQPVLDASGAPVDDKLVLGTLTIP